MSVGRFSQLAASLRSQGNYGERKKEVNISLTLPPPTCNSQPWRSLWGSSQRWIKDALETSIWS